jgi:hypothetical protein
MTAHAPRHRHASAAAAGYTIDDRGTMVTVASRSVDWSPQDKPARHSKFGWPVVGPSTRLRKIGLSRSSATSSPPARPDEHLHRQQPSRFATAGSSDRPRATYYPFGMDQRMCIGSTLSLVEQQPTIAMIAQA